MRLAYQLHNANSTAKSDRLLAGLRQPETENRAGSRRRCDIQLAAECSSVVSCLMDANTHALTAFGAVEWAEEPVSDEFLRHAAAGICD